MPEEGKFEEVMDKIRKRRKEQGQKIKRELEDRKEELEREVKGE